jgi:hypothetical protein
VSVTAWDVIDVTGTIAANGTPVSAAKDTPGQNINLTFTGSAGQRVCVQGSQNTFASWINLNLFEPDPSGTLLAQGA